MRYFPWKLELVSNILWMIVGCSIAFTVYYEHIRNVILWFYCWLCTCCMGDWVTLTFCLLNSLFFNFSMSSSLLSSLLKLLMLLTLLASLAGFFAVAFGLRGFFSPGGFFSLGFFSLGFLGAGGFFSFFSFLAAGFLLAGAFFFVGGVYWKI